MGMGFMTLRRGPTSRGELDIGWKYPAYVPEVRESLSGESLSVEVKHALELERAFRVIAGDDARPLLVLRECLTCTGTDDALMTRGADNEKTMLMSRWFHCVKLPPAVLEPDHPFHRLFAGESPPHLFVSRADGSGRLTLNGEQSRTELWDKMETLLTSEYTTKHKPALKKLFKVLDELDELDVRLAELDGRMNDTIEKDGPDSRKVKKLQKALAKLHAERNDLRAHAGQLSTLAFKKKQAPKHAAATDSGDDAA